MIKKSLEVIQSIVSAEIYKEHADEAGEKGGAVTLPPLVSISRGYGAGGSETGRLLAERLGLEFFDETLLKSVIKTAQADKHIMERLDERVTSGLEDLLHSILSKKAATKEDYLHYLMKVLLGISMTGGVILGRGAHLILSQKKIFRVRIEGSLEVCAERVAQRENMKKSKARAKIQDVDAEREKYLKKVAKRFADPRMPYDLILNSDNLTPAAMVEVILAAMRQAGFSVP